MNERRMAELHLESPRLVMHALEREDEALFCELFTDRETMQFIGPMLTSDRAVRSFRAALRANVACPRRAIFLRVMERTSLQAVGICSIQHVDLGRRRAELGVMLRRARCTQGLGKEVLSALVRYAFRLFPIEEAWVQYAPGHLAAERLVISTGFSPSAHGAPDEHGASKCVWSAFRGSWDYRSHWKQIGEDACRM